MSYKPAIASMSLGRCFAHHSLEAKFKAARHAGLSGIEMCKNTIPFNLITTNTKLPHSLRRSSRLSLYPPLSPISLLSHPRRTIYSLSLLILWSPNYCLRSFLLPRRTSLWFRPKIQTSRTTPLVPSLSNSRHRYHSNPLNICFLA